MRDFGRVERMIDNNLEFLAGRLLDIAQISFLFHVTKRQSNPLGPAACSPANPVDIAFRLIGKLVVDHMGDVLHINSTGGNVGRNKYANFAALEVTQGALAGRLLLVTVNGIRRNTDLGKELVHTICTAFGARKDQHPLQFGVLQKIPEQ